MKKRINPSECLLATWEKIYKYEQEKFIRATYLSIEDLHTTFFDSNTEWEIVGQMENTDIVCKNLSNGQYFIWDRWKVSQLKHPDKHSFTVFKKNKKLKPIEKKANPQCIQLFLTFEEPIKEEVIVDESEIESIDLDEIEVIDYEECDNNDVKNQFISLHDPIDETGQEK